MNFRCFRLRDFELKTAYDKCQKGNKKFPVIKRSVLHYLFNLIEQKMTVFIAYICEIVSRR